MVVVIVGVRGNTDLSGYVVRPSLEITAAVGKRMDTCRFQLFDPDQELLIPPRAEIIIYDYPAANLPVGWTLGDDPIIDPPPASPPQRGFAYNDSNQYDTSAAYDAAPPQAANNWTQRMFGGYVASATYSVVGNQRDIAITAQDYTFRNKTTVVNRSYVSDAAHPGGWSDQQIIDDLYARYRPDIDTTYVQTLVTNLPDITFPTHTLEQFFERIIKITQGYFRVDYFKRLQYGNQGQQAAPFNLSDDPDLTATPPTLGMEAATYAPDVSNLFDRIWVLGSTFQGNSQSYQIAPKPNGDQFAFPMPQRLQDPTTVTVTVNGTDQGTVGVIPVDGTLDNQAGFRHNVLFQPDPPLLAFKTDPPANATIVVTGIFKYPLIRIVNDAARQAALGGLVFEKVLRDKRIDSLALADAVGTANLALQGAQKKGGTVTIRRRGIGGQLLQPGQTIQIQNSALFQGLLDDPQATSFNAFINRLTIKMVDTLNNDPDGVPVGVDPDMTYEVTIDYADQVEQSDLDLLDHMMGEQSRINAALEQTDLHQIVQDAQLLTDSAGMTDSITATLLSTATPVYDGAYKYGFAKYSV